MPHCLVLVAAEDSEDFEDCAGGLAAAAAAAAAAALAVVSGAAVNHQPVVQLPVAAGLKHQLAALLPVVCPKAKVPDQEARLEMWLAPVTVAGAFAIAAGYVLSPVTSAKSPVMCKP
jgi:hypothetical protein